jgi:hypothetical protein
VPADLVEPEGVNAGSADAMRDAPPTGDPVPGGDAAAGPPSGEPADDILGAPPEDDADDVYGSQPPG